MPRGLPKSVKRSLEKSRDAALLAIENYNKPAIKFRSGGYVVLMSIAITALFHAIFFNRKIKPFHRKEGSNRFKRRDGDYDYWELKTCLKEYYKSDTSNPVRKNIEFFIPLRNKIEHKSLPEIDTNIFGECQALLFNYDSILEKEFGAKYCIKESLSFSLQLFPSKNNLDKSMSFNADAENTMKFIEKYRSSLSHETIDSGKYSFKAFLVQVANHKSKEALPIQFIKYDELSEQEKGRVKKVTALIKEKIVEKPVSNKDLLLPAQIVKEVQALLGNPKKNSNGKEKDKFNPDTHTRCWKKYQVRPAKNSNNPSNTKEQFCIYDDLTGHYGYTKKWISFLVEKMNDENEYNTLYK
jgi:hypothetical protein